jgi:hypothetical protein
MRRPGNVGCESMVLSVMPDKFMTVRRGSLQMSL